MSRIVSTPVLVLLDPILTSFGYDGVDTNVYNTQQGRPIINFFPQEKLGYLRSTEATMWGLWLKIFLLSSLFTVVILFCAGILLQKYLSWRSQVSPNRKRVSYIIISLGLALLYFWKYLFPFPFVARSYCDFGSRGVEFERRYLLMKEHGLQRDFYCGGRLTHEYSMSFGKKDGVEKRWEPVRPFCPDALVEETIWKMGVITSQKTFPPVCNDMN